jgi:hypothetical protein
MEETFKVDPTIQYDVVPLPSQGIYYKNGKKNIRVAYLTAADENILQSPNLSQSNSATIIDELLKRKVLDKDILFDEFVDEDIQAILVFLRNTAFGSDYTIKLNDPATNKEFTANLDLSVLKTKDFNLIPDSNGEYSFFLPVSQKTITFKFLTKKQQDELDKIKNDTSVAVPPSNTKRLEMLIKSIEGNRDPMAIYTFIQNMPIKDSQAIRKFVNENKPGLDLIVEVTAPSGEKIPVLVDFGVEFFRPFYGI